MTVSVYGVDGSLNEARWSEMADMFSDPLVRGMAPSVTANSTRQVTVDTGKAYVPGVLIKSDAAATVTLDANNGSNPRIDLVVAQVNWAGAGGAGAVSVVKGTNAANPTRPVLTQDFGTLWQVPLAAVTVDPGVGQLAEASLADVRPSGRAAKVYKDVVNTASVLASNTDGAQRAQVAVPDPGWPYFVEVMGAVAFQTITSGRGVAIVTVDDVELTRGRTDNGAGAPAVIRTEWTGVRNGSTTVKLIVAPLNASDPLVPVAAQSGLTVVVHRA